MFWLIDTAEACFILEHEPDSCGIVENFGQFADSGVNFFERLFQTLCKPPAWCRIEALHRRFYYEQQKETQSGGTRPEREDPGATAKQRCPTKMEEQDKYFGLVVCADCGATMVLHRAHTMKPTWNNFTCYTYKKKGKEVCTAHYIRECILDEMVLEDLRRVTAMAREHTREFAEYVGRKQSAEIQRDIRRLERELTAVRKRSAELETHD